MLAAKPPNRFNLKLKKNTENQIERLFDNPYRIARTQEEFEKADAFVLVYSCVDKASYTRVEQLLMSLQDMDLIRTRPVIIAANKIDLARSRAVSSQGTVLFYIL